MPFSGPVTIRHLFPQDSCGSEGGAKNDCPDVSPELEQDWSADCTPGGWAPAASRSCGESDPDPGASNAWRAFHRVMATTAEDADDSDALTTAIDIC
jgi:hypothetical protein